MCRSASGARTHPNDDLWQGSKVELSVIDFVSGILDQKIGEIFATFYATEEHGTGLGLSIARTIIETYGRKT